MGLKWSSLANRDLVRLHGFLEPVSEVAAARAVELILAGVRRIAAHPQLGRKMNEFLPREVRRITVGDYEIRYQVRDRDLVILRLWHAREDR